MGLVAGLSVLHQLHEMVDPVGSGLQHGQPPSIGERGCVRLSMGARPASANASLFVTIYTLITWFDRSEPEPRRAEP